MNAYFAVCPPSGRIFGHRESAPLPNMWHLVHFTVHCEILRQSTNYINWKYRMSLSFVAKFQKNKGVSIKGCACLDKTEKTVPKQKFIPDQIIQ